MWPAAPIGVSIMFAVMVLFQIINFTSLLKAILDVLVLLCIAKKVVESTSNKLQFLIDALELD
jgi:hypothetical protein